MADILSSLASAAGAAGGGGFQEGYLKTTLGTNGRNTQGEPWRCYGDTQGNIYTINVPFSNQTQYVYISKYSTASREYLWSKRLTVSDPNGLLYFNPSSSSYPVGALTSDGFYLGTHFYPTFSDSATMVGFYKFDLEDGSLLEHNVRQSSDPSGWQGRAGYDYSLGLVVTDNGSIVLEGQTWSDGDFNRRALLATWDASRNFYMFILETNRSAGFLYKTGANQVTATVQGGSPLRHVFTINSSSVPTRTQTYNWSEGSRISSYNLNFKSDGGYYMSGETSFYDTQMRYLYYVAEFDSSYTKIGEMYYGLGGGTTDFVVSWGTSGASNFIVDENGDPKYLISAARDFSANNYNYILQTDISSTVSSSSTFTTVRTKNASDTNNVSTTPQNYSATNLGYNEYGVTRQYSGNFTTVIDFFFNDLNNFSTSNTTYGTTTNVQRGTYWFTYTPGPSYLVAPTAKTGVSNSPSQLYNWGGIFGTVTVTNTITDNTYTIATGDL